MSKRTNQIALFLVFLLVLTPFAFASELQIKKVSDLQPGDVIVDQKTGKEIPVEKLQETDYKISTNLIQILTGKLSANPMTGNVVAPITGKLTGVASADSATEAMNEYDALFGEGSTPGIGEAGFGGSGASTTQLPVAPVATDQAWLAQNVFKTTAGSFGSSLASGVQWAAVAYLAGQMLGPMFGLDKKQTDSLSLSLAAGAGAYEFLAIGAQQGGFLTKATAGSFQGLATGGNGIMGFVNTPLFIGVAIAAAVFILTYKDTKTETVTFTCQPWQAPTTKEGGTNCEVCNDETLPCSEYRCKSIGQACELVNPGTGEEKCVYVNPKDVTPPVITPNPEDLPSKSYKYTNVKLSPPGPGFTITYLNNSADGCVKAFTPLTFGITTDEPSQCKIDFNHTEKLADMAYWMGGSNLYRYNHTEQFSLPGPANLKDENLTIDNGGKWTFFIRCKDKNGNENSADYALRFCVDPTPDTTSPVVKATSIENGACVSADTQNASVNFYLNEPATCKWSKTDQTFDNMQSNMTCSNRLEQMNAQQLYTCNAKLDSIARDGTDYYVRCQDNAKNNMSTSYKFNLKGSTPLLIKTAKPNETVFGGVNPAPVELFVQTNFGCEDNKAICLYSTTGNLGDFIEFLDTNNAEGINTQKLFFAQGTQKVYVRCVDSGGNVANTTLNFNVEIDTNAPVVARAYQEDDQLKIVTVRDSECSYTNDNCDFLFEEGTKMPIANTTTHVTPWVKDKTYYIKCRDEFNNEEAGCSAIIKPMNNFL